MSRLRARGLTKTFAGRRGQPVCAVAPLDLDLEGGELVALVGPSGSGKTTLQLMLGAMLAPTAGQVLIDDQDIYDVPDAARARLRRERIGFVFQACHLVPYLSARENVQVPLWLSRLSPQEQAARADALLRKLGLAERATHTPDELSAGQQQRVAMARVLANEPDIVLADEPTGNLDPDNAERIVAFLRGCAGQGAAVLVVTHDPAVADRADRVLRMEAGELVRSR